MFKKISFFLLVLIIVFLINACTQPVVENNSEGHPNLELEAVSKSPIGGNRDEHGCLGSAGYNWNEDLGVCLREWELDDNQREAVKIAIQSLDYEVTIIEVLDTQCLGCFEIRLQRNDNREMFNISMEDWKVIE